MKERPIIFSNEMVRAILDGRKTQTRRVIKPQPPIDCEAWSGWIIDSIIKKNIGAASWTDIPGVLFSKEHIVKCAYGKPGDLFWVRETWRPGAWREDGRLAIDYKASPELTNTPWITIPDDDLGEKFESLWIKLTDELLALGLKPGEDDMFHWEPGKCPLKWRSSIFMPRWASRITLKIINVRVERLQEIDMNGFVAEGIHVDSLSSTTLFSERDTFIDLWNQINLKRGYSWDSNPWVWVIEFEMVKGG